jgi:hypothetical protein
MLDEKEMAWVFIRISLGKPMPSLAHMRRVLHSLMALVNIPIKVQQKMVITDMYSRLQEVSDIDKL